MPISYGDGVRICTGGVLQAQERLGPPTQHDHNEVIPALCRKGRIVEDNPDAAGGWTSGSSRQIVWIGAYRETTHLPITG